MPMEYGALSAYRQVLQSSGARAPAAAAATVVETGTATAATARENAPVLTGELRDSIHFILTGATTGEVRADSDHAEYVEDGTSVMAPEPYMGPAADAHQDDLGIKLVETVTQGL